MAAVSLPLPLSLRKNIEGITLHVEKYGTDCTQDLTFYKKDTTSFTIGRKSSSSGSQDDGDESHALFRCPVISRRHAKITFTDYGNVYVSDLSSHHGTHILRPGETVSTMINPQQPTILADGDILTFGKTVGRDETLVRPVTARIHFIIGPESITSAPEPAALSSKPSGRYGVYDTGLTSSGSDSSDSDSDIEEVPQPLPNSSQSFGCMPPSPLFTPGASARIALLRKILPRVGSMEELATSQKESNRFSPISVSSSSSRSPSIVELAPARFAEALRQLTPPPVPAPPLLSLDYGEADMDKERGDSIASLESLPEEQDLSVVATSAEFCACEPQDTVAADDSFSDMYATPTPVESSVHIEAPQPLPPAQILDYFAEFDESWARNSFDLMPLDDMPAPSGRGSDIFSSRVETLRSRLADLEQRMQSQQPSSPTDEAPAVSTPELIGGSGPKPKPESEAVVEHEDMPVQARVFESQSESRPEPQSEPGADHVTSVEAVPAVVHLKELLKAFENMHKKAEEEMAKELAAVRAARAEAEAAAAEAKARIASPVARAVDMDCTTGLPELYERISPLKRRRDDADDSLDDVPSPAKRQRRDFALAKRIAAGVVKTTAVAAVGAVATWSALAFS